MKLKNKIKFIIIFSILMMSILTVSYARYVLNKSVDVNIYAPPSDAGSLDCSIKNKENIYNVSTNDDKITVSSKITISNKYNIQIKSYYAWTTSNTAPSDDDYKEFDFENNEYNITR